MKKFLIRVFFFVLIFVVLDRSFGLILQSQRPTDYRQFIESKLAFFENTRSTDVLIIGDSHIADALDPRTIEDNLSLETFNLGIYHSSPIENYFVTKAALEHLEKKPKVIVLGTNPVMFERELSKGKYSPLILPTNYSLELTYYSKEGFDASFFFSTIREKYLIKPMINNLLGKKYSPTRKITNVHHGHSMFYNQVEDAEWNNFEKPKKKKVYKEQIEYFKKTIQLAIKNDIQVIIVHSPIWKKEMEVLVQSKPYKSFEKTIREMEEKFNLLVFDGGAEWSSNAFQQKDFLNSQHLNYYGSKKFTNEFCEFLTNNNVLESE